MISMQTHAAQRVQTDAAIRAAAVQLYNRAEQLKQWREQNQFLFYYPDAGPLRRELYPKHLRFFKAGAKFRERMLRGGNQSGKTLCGAYETTCHLTGIYPDWWPGRRFDKPVRAWCAGVTVKDARDSLQVKLLGEHSKRGTGMIPAANIERFSSRAGVPDAIDTLYVKHVTGGTSTLGLKSYDQGRESFQSTVLDVIWLDEEPSMEIYGEALMRTTTTNGLVYVTCTPLKGMTELMKAFGS